MTAPKLIVTMRVEVIDPIFEITGEPVPLDQLVKVCERASQFSTAREAFEQALDGAGIETGGVSLVVKEAPNFDFTASDYQAEVTYTPWTDGWAVGFKATREDGRTEFVYLNPSSDGGGDPDHTPCVFVYQGPVGDPAQDPGYHFYEVFGGEE